MALQNLLFIFAALFICFGLTNGDEFEGRFKLDLPTIIVDASIKSGPSTIQAAIDAVPANNKNWITISVKAGVYNEQVRIPVDKPFIYLKGEGIGKTNVVWGATDLSSPTFYSMADNIMVSGITFVNSYNYPPSNNANPVTAALAARISGDKSAFYDCSFLGFQDTLMDESGRHYFLHCTIEGAIDFIFGNGQSIYQSCNIRVNLGGREPNFRGFITAQGRDHPKDSSGFVFNNCSVSGNGEIFLGRAWRSYSRVIFSHSILSDIVIPLGWSAWSFDGHENTITYVEDQCEGAGSLKSKRVKWEKTLSPIELQSLTNISYIDNEGWISKLPPQ